MLLAKLHVSETLVAATEEQLNMPKLSFADLKHTLAPMLASTVTVPRIIAASNAISSSTANMPLNITASYTIKQRHDARKQLHLQRFYVEYVGSPSQNLAALTTTTSTQISKTALYLALRHASLTKRSLELIHSWGFALREGVFTETKEGICRN